MCTPAAVESGCRYPHGHMLQRVIEETILYAKDFLAYEIEDPESRAKYQGYLLGSLSRRARGDALHILLTKLARVSVNDFDADPWVLCVSNGLIDLRTGELIPHRPDALCTKQINLDYDPQATCPQFMEFIHWAMGGGPDATPEEQAHAEMMVDFLQRLFGCCTTGIFEKMIVFFYGKLGNNGKSVLLDTIREALGPYSGQLQIDALIASKSETSNNINADLMQLKGLRMAVSSEPEEDRTMNISRIKYLCGGGKVKARRLRADPVEFQMVCKLLVELNHLLKITNANDPIWNRVHCVPFLAEISEEKIDTGLREKLKTELPGILAWIVQGAAWYACSGIQFPAELNVIKQDYRVAADHFPLFVEDSIQSDAGSNVPVEQLWLTYEKWTQTNAETPLNHHQFKSRLQGQGFQQDRATVGGKQCRVWKGMKLICKAPGTGILARSL